MFVGQVLELRRLLRKQELRVIDRNRKVQILAAFEIHGSNPNDFADHVEKRAAAATMRDRRSNLQELAFLFFAGSDTAANTVGNRKFRSKRVDNCDDLFANLNLIRVTETE